MSAAAVNTRRLPKTATSAGAKMFAGSMLLLLSLILLVLNRRQALAL